MTQELWTAVDEFFDAPLGGEDPVLLAALSDAAAAGLRPISVSRAQGRFLQILAASIGARRILEIGTLGGYSGIHLARALPADGRLVSLEIDPRSADVARRCFERAGVLSRVDVRVGPALETLPRLEAEGLAPFDLFFIDADKPSTPAYARWALRLSRPGSVIVVDNVVRRGEVLADSPDASSAAMRELTTWIAGQPELTATVLQTVGTKGHDGMLLVHVGQLASASRTGPAERDGRASLPSTR